MVYANSFARSNFDTRLFLCPLCTVQLLSQTISSPNVVTLEKPLITATFDSGDTISCQRRPNTS